jgi:hypothetical protein
MTTLAAINDFKTSVDAAIEAMYLETSNIHFYVPQVVSAIFTRRNDLSLRHQRQSRTIVSDDLLSTEWLGLARRNFAANLQAKTTIGKTHTLSLSLSLISICPN